jgi:hypothetical protein
MLVRGFPYQVLRLVELLPKLDERIRHWLTIIDSL